MTRLETCSAPLGSPYYQDIMNDATVRILDAVKASNNTSQDVANNVKRLLEPVFLPCLVDIIMASLDKKMHGEPNEHATQQVNTFLDNYLEWDYWTRFDDPLSTIEISLYMLALLFVRLGLHDANFETYARGAMLVAQAHEFGVNDALTYTRKLKELVTSILMSYNNVAVYSKGPINYPEDIAEFRATYPDVYKQAFPADDPVPSMWSHPCRNKVSTIATKLEQRIKRDEHMQKVQNWYRAFRQQCGILAMSEVSARSEAPAQERIPCEDAGPPLLQPPAEVLGWNLSFDDVTGTFQKHLPFHGPVTEQVAGPPSRLEGAAHVLKAQQAAAADACAEEEQAQQHKQPKKQPKKPKPQQQQQTTQQRPQRPKPIHGFLKKPAVKTPSASAKASRMATIKCGKVEYNGAFIYSVPPRKMFRIIMTPPNAATEVCVAWEGLKPTRADWAMVIDRVDAYKLCLCYSTLHPKRHGYSIASGL